MKPPSRDRVHAAVRFVLVGAAATGVVLAVPHLTWSADLGPNLRDRIALERTAVTAASVSCPGPELVGLPGARDIPARGTLAAAAPPAPGGAAPGDVLVVGGDRQPVDGAGTVARADLPATGPVELSGTGAAAPGLVGAQSWAVASDGARGLVSAACGPAATDVWLVAGGNQPGRQERVVLANPGANEVLADVVVHGAAGPVESATGRGVVVPSHGRAAVLLDAIAGTEATPVVHVTATGGALRATLNDTWVDGAVAAGSDSTTPAAAPSRRAVVPAVLVPARGAGSATLRVANTGDSPAVVQVRALGPKGGRPVTGGVRTVAPGAVTDVDLASLAGTSVALEVRADGPVVAGVRTLLREGQGPADFSWTAAADAVSDLSGTTLPEHPAARSALGLVATGGVADVDVVTIGGDGRAATRRVHLAADTSTDVDVTGAQAVWVRTVRSAGASRAEVRGAVRTSIDVGTAPLVTTTMLTAAPVDAPTSRIVPLP